MGISFICSIQRPNQDYMGSLTNVKYYSPGSMCLKADEVFWVVCGFAAMEFKQKRTLVYYYRKNVEILRKACKTFQEQMIKISQCEFLTDTVWDIADETKIQCIDLFQCVTFVSVLQGSLLYNVLVRKYYCISTFRWLSPKAIFTSLMQG